ncbi:MAG: hypothetical protein NZ651_00975 [Candidatus Bipolaricaulota bacterium]|nr:hypothetical protein [Candidatus Bipolaricaulota bacterium]MDW8126341.1 hypothetical protein [Candidatus Bipolaricaulota bacterium]
MALERLLEVLQMVRERAEKHRADLEKSEALTRYALIDPVLRALGWDTENPTQVRPEFATDTGTPDYALLWEGKPHVMVEAKALGKKLEGAQDKAFHYAYQNGVPYFVTTDGLRWELYDVFERDKDKRRLFVVNLAEGEAQAARVLLALWRPAMPAVAVPPQPVIVPPPKGRLSLTELLAKMERKKIPQGSKPPNELHLPDGQTVSIKYWRDLVTAVVAWAMEHARLPVPLRFPSTGRVLVAKTPEGMRAPKEVKGYYVETHASALYVLKFTQAVLAEAGLDPKDFQVTLRSS